MNMIRQNDTEVQIYRYGRPPKCQQMGQTTSVSCHECSVTHEYTAFCSAKNENCYTFDCLV
jgi:hypothetical protein